MNRSIGLFLALTAAAVYGQQLTLSGPTTAKPGATVNLNLAVSASTGTGAAFEWQVNLPAGFTATAAAGAASTSAAKTLTCTASFAFCLLYGQNVSTITDGVVATYAVKIPTTAVGSNLITLSSLLGASAASPATALTVTSGVPYSIAVIAKQDLNGDGKIDITDVNLMAAEVLDSQTNPSACVDDQDGDGKCTLIDVMVVLLKALGF